MSIFVKFLLRSKFWYFLINFSTFYSTLTNNSFGFLHLVIFIVIDGHTDR